VDVQATGRSKAGAKEEGAEAGSGNSLISERKFGSCRCRPLLHWLVAKGSVRSPRARASINPPDTVAPAAGAASWCVSLTRKTTTLLMEEILNAGFGVGSGERGERMGGVWKESGDRARPCHSERWWAVIAGSP